VACGLALPPHFYLAQLAAPRVSQYVASASQMTVYTPSAHAQYPIGVTLRNDRRSSW